jgi:hypothetical protein
VKRVKSFLLQYLCIAAAFAAFQCASGNLLTESERAKLDPPIRQLLEEGRTDDARLNVVTLPDGAKEYAVIIRSDRPAEIRSLGITITSVIDDMIVAHASVDELRKLVSLPSVRAVLAGSKRTIQHD